jgi:hypothetical protein
MKNVTLLSIAALSFLAIAAAGSKPAWAVPHCPPLCILPPDPAPPMPPINFPDPPFGGTIVKQGGGSGGGTTSGTAAPAGASAEAGSSTTTENSAVTGPRQEGASCQYQGVTGKVTKSEGKYYCDFTPPAEGSACEYEGSSGTVTIIEGRRYCKI